MDEQLILTLLSGLFGAVIASGITIWFTVWRDSKEQKKSLAREKLEKVYGPLVALKKKIDKINKNDHAFLLPSNPAEKEMIEKILFHYYHLFDEDLKDGIMFLHPDLSRDNMIMGEAIRLKVVDKIFTHYHKNRKILGLK